MKSTFDVLKEIPGISNNITWRDDSESGGKGNKEKTDDMNNVKDINECARCFACSAQSNQQFTFGSENIKQSHKLYSDAVKGVTNPPAKKFKLSLASPSEVKVQVDGNTEELSTISQENQNRANQEHFSQVHMDRKLIF